MKDKIALKDQELGIKDQLISLEEKRGDIYKQAFETEKELTDRALKLAESGKTDIWKVLAGLGLVAIIVTVIAAAF